MDNNDNDSQLNMNRVHPKRLGREIAMQYIFSCESSGETLGASSFEIFFEVMESELNLNNNRTARKVKDYSEKLYVAYALNLDEINKKIQSFIANWEVDRLSSVDLNIMRIAVTEMMYFDNVPPVVCIDEAVEIALDFSGATSGNFINGVLNAIKDSLKK